ncbi:MAG: hypothetical protein ACRDJN_32405, partial [Chloroflexota bacterium]
EYAEAKGFMAEVAPQATAQAEAAAQAAASATAEAEARQAALAEYGQKVAASSRRYADALGAFSQLATEAGQRPALILDDVWRTKAAAALAFMMNAADEMAAIQPVPPEMARVSDLLKQIAAETRLLTQDFGHGVDNLDAQRMQSARTRLERIGALATQATAEVQKVTR